MSTAERSYRVTKSELADLCGSNYGGSHEKAAEAIDPLAVACSALSAGADDLMVLRLAVEHDELDAQEFGSALWRVACRLRGAAELSWRAGRDDEKAVQS